MINGATVTLAGFVATEPVFRTVNEATRKVSLRVAWSSRYQDKVTGEWRDSKTSFANVNCWRRMASNVASSLRKGEPVVVTGRLSVREYDNKEGQHRIVVDIEADAIGHDLSRGVTHFQRTLRPTGDEAPQHHQGDLSKGEGVADGLAVGGLASQGSLDQEYAGQEPVSGAGEASDMFDQDAVDALAAAATAEPAAVGAPF